MKTTRKLTQTETAKLEIPQNGQRIYRDSEMKGFAVRITSTGFKSYIVEKKIGGKTYRRVIGATNIYSNEAARIEGQRLLLELSQGKDPKISKVERELQSITLWEIYNAYKCDGDKELRQKTIAIYDDVIQRCLSDWRNKPIAEITREMVAARLEKILDDASKRKESAKKNVKVN